MGGALFLQVGEEKGQPTGNQEGEMRSWGTSENLLVQSAISHLPVPAVPAGLIPQKALTNTL